MVKKKPLQPVSLAKKEKRQSEKEEKVCAAI